MSILHVVGEATPVLRTDRVLLRPPVLADHVAWVALREESRLFLKPWEPVWAADDLTRSAFKRRVKLYHRAAREDLGYAFFLFRVDEPHVLLGGITLSNVRRGVIQSCSLGYWMGERYAGKGYMTEAVRTIITYVFHDLKLHRLEAASIPHNTRSIRLLEKAGFSREGFARRFLMIDGRWQDHILFALLSDDPRPAPRYEPAGVPATGWIPA
ncbi:GNAT family N-acetyltransferase [Mongoliimonas terrestris]|uniref:GNAT family N-acetyltransferase n=1 Tax=Mongoliimonas terrestris TaxID=1709001 RepID=UPI000949A78B|nr:GNAT family N-acetyltransferase [Mongoliimonas terrestris]